MQMSVVIKSSAALPTSNLPKGVRNAPPVLRRAIRRNQNKESAKRSREKKREEEEQMHRQIIENKQRIEYLEKRIHELSTVISNKKICKNRDVSDSKSPRDDHSKDRRFCGDPF